MSYEDFIERKRIAVPPSGIDNPPALNPLLFPFQTDITRWALRIGKAAIWADCGLGKTFMSLEWARVVSAHSDAPVLILTPLAVAQQFKTEGEKIGVGVTVCREAEDLRGGINVLNYERLHKIDPGDFGGVVLDESSCLKDYTSATRNALIEAFRATPFRLCCTATPAPNDFMELANHAEFLGAMSRAEMLAMFFVHDGGETQKWRIKGHGIDEFWKWICSWAVTLRMPSDLGYDNAGFDLPPLNIHEHMVHLDAALAREQGALFTTEALTLHDQRRARKVSLVDRVAMAASMINDDDETWIVWCDLNAESEALTKSIRGAVEVCGSQSSEVKEERMHAFTRGETRVLVTKPSIAGHGMNWQHCSHVAFVGLSHSFEAWYQAIRRTYRFGQERPVECHMITSDAEGAVASNLKRKQRDAEEMQARMIANMTDINRANIATTVRSETKYEPATEIVIPSWLKSEENVA